jgi:hypothetical protein
MGKGGGGGGEPPTHTTATTTNLPEYVEPYFTKLLERAEVESEQPYTPYGGQRISGLAPEHEEAIAHVGEVARQGRGGAQILEASDILRREGGYAPASVGYDYTPTGVPYDYTPTGVPYDYTPQGVGYTPAAVEERRFTDPGVASAYMNPYLENVLERQRAQMRADYEENIDPALRHKAVQAGAFGGSRGAIRRGTERARFEDRLATQASQQRAAAYQQGQAAFVQDRERAQRAQAMRAEAAKTGAEVGLREQAMRAEAAKTGAEVGLREQQLLSEVAKTGAEVGLREQQLYQTTAQQRAQTALDSGKLGLAGSQQRAAAAKPLAAMGEAETAWRLKQGDVLRQIGDIRSAEEQQRMDMGYADFLSQRDYPRSQLGYLGGILHGVPVSPTQETSVYKAQPPIPQQLMGFGLGAASLMNQLR